MKVRMSTGLWILLIYKESLFFSIVGSNGREIWRLGIGTTTVQVLVDRIKCQKHN
jgi:hypothetical protein